MKIENLKSEKKGSRKRVAATVIWEDCERPTQEVYFETGEAFAQDLSCNPNAFLVACAIPAMHYGEKRVSIDAELCPELRNGLMTAMGWLHHWFGSVNGPVKIEARMQTSPQIPKAPSRAGFFFSGGIDSYATLRTNRLYFPAEHPWSIKDGLLVYGLELDEAQAFEHVMNLLSDVAPDVGITLIPVYTNIYLIYRKEDSADGWPFWKEKFNGAALAAVAHALAKRLTVVSIASGRDLTRQIPRGSHPLVDPNFSSVDLRIRHDGINLTRLAKTQLVANWDVAFRHLRVCNQFRLYRAGELNCGTCEKCIRTMLALLALGALDKSQVFPFRDFSEEQLEAALKLKPNTITRYEELLGPLSEKGRYDLVRVIERKIAECRQRIDRETGGWKTNIRQFDRKILNGRLVRLKRSLFR